MNIDMLVLEVTRQCNMSCAHCLRGCSQNVKMTTEMVDKIFQDITSVGSITFTGGEPFLNLDIIEYTLRVVKNKKIPVYGFYIVTNGKHYEDRQIKVCNNWMMYIASCNNNITKSVNGFYFDSELIFNYSGLCVSRDIYHDDIPIENYLHYRMLSYYLEDKEDLSEDYIINEGNAILNGIGVVNRTYNEISVFGEEIMEDGFVSFQNISTEGYLYISANGNIVGDCDMSYDTIDDETIGNINKISLKQILKNYYFQDKQEIA